mgnify:CR=1 FL=1
MNWYIEVLKKYAVFSGRSRRSEYWYFALFNIIASIILAVLDGITGTYNPETGMGLLSIIYALAILIPSIAVTFRRLHDTGRSAWWLLIALIPLIGFIVILVFMLQDSHEEENRYGISPKFATA